MLHRCYNKYLEFDRSSVKTSDYQRVKLTELDDQLDGAAAAAPEPERQGDARGGASTAAASSAARVPRTIEVEVRDTLVNTCIPGDLLCIVGIVKTVQVCSNASFVYEIFGYILTLLRSRH